MSAPVKMDAPAIFRFDFSPVVVREIAAFAELHMNDERKDYKKAWEPWCEKNAEMISEEITRLKQIGYDGDTHDKMFKSGRYYFRKKSKAVQGSAVQGSAVQGSADAPKKRLYITIEPDTLSHIDAHIRKHMQDNDFTPKSGYDEFLNSHHETVMCESENLKRKFEMSDTDIKTKIKKTYKNRYYIITRNY